MHYSHPKRSGRLEVDDNGDVIEGIGVMNDDSKDSLVMKGTFTRHKIVIINCYYTVLKMKFL